METKINNNKESTIFHKWIKNILNSIWMNFKKCNKINSRKCMMISNLLEKCNNNSKNKHECLNRKWDNNSKLYAKFVMWICMMGSLHFWINVDMGFIRIVSLNLLKYRFLLIISLWNARVLIAGVNAYKETLNLSCLLNFIQNIKITR